MSFAKLSDLLAALPRLIVDNMARGVYLIGSIGIGVPDCEYHDMALAIVDYGFGWCTNVQGASSQRLESIDLAEVDFFSLDPR